MMADPPSVSEGVLGPVGDPVRDLADRLAGAGYVADRSLAMVLHLAQELESPVLLEGEPGVGKTSVAEALASVTQARLVRLQCYEGLAAHHALYEWDYTRQLLDIRLAEAAGTAGDSETRSHIFSPEYLLRRPTIILTANRTRSLSDALRRRCLYHWIPYPTLDREMAILQARLPEASASLVRQTCLFVERIRAGYYRKAPGVSETLDWLKALTLLGTTQIDPPRVEETLGVLLKDSEDIRLFTQTDSDRVYRELGLRTGT